MSSFLGKILRPLPALMLAVVSVDAADSAGALTVAAREAGIAEVLVLKPRADRGDVGAQVGLGDLFHGRQQFAEAAYWYRQAATNGEVTAQLALAGYLIAGRGTAENRREAAHWMRLAADGVEKNGVRTPASSRSSAVPSIIVTRSNTIPAATKTSTTSASTKNLFTIGDSHSTRVTRDDNLSAVDPKTQERRVGVQPVDAPK